VEAGADLRFAAGGEWVTVTDAPLRRTVVRGGDDPRGWVARSLGVKAAATYVAFEASLATPLATFVTVIALPDDTRPVRAIRHDGSRVFVDDERGGIEVVVPSSPSATAPLASCSRWLDGRRTWSREIGRTE
jgi:hypothetical protein